MTELTFEEFCLVPLAYRTGIVGNSSASRMYRNDELGIQREVHTKRKVPGDIYSGWKDGEVFYFMDDDAREFRTAADLYVAWMARVCGVVMEDQP